MSLMSEQWKYIHISIKMIKFQGPTLPVFFASELFPDVCGQAVVDRKIPTIYYRTVHAHCHGSQAQALKWHDESYLAH